MLCHDHFEKYLEYFSQSQCLEIYHYYFCNCTELNKEYTYSVDNKLVIGLLHNAKKCDVYDIDYINNHQITGPMCEARNSMPIEELNFGMGDIFIRLAN